MGFGVAFALAGAITWGLTALSGSFFVTVELVLCGWSDLEAVLANACLLSFRSVRRAVGLAAVVNLETRAFSLLRAATLSPVAAGEFCGRGLAMTLLSDDAAETLVSDGPAGRAGTVFDSATVFTTG